MDSLSYPSKKTFSFFFCLLLGFQLSPVQEGKTQHDESSLKWAHLGYYAARIGLLLINAQLSTIAGQRWTAREEMKKDALARERIKSHEEKRENRASSTEFFEDLIRDECKERKSLGLWVPALLKMPDPPDPIFDASSRIFWFGNTLLPWFHGYIFSSKQNSSQGGWIKQLLGIVMQFGGALLRYEGSNFWYFFGRERGLDNFSMALFFSVAGLATEEYGASLRCANSGAIKVSVKLSDCFKKRVKSNDDQPKQNDQSGGLKVQMQGGAN